MDALTYKVIHLAGVMVLFLGLGTAFLPDSAHRRRGVMLHGIGLFVILVAGFGLLAKLQLGFPGWVIVKLVLFLLLGALPGVGKRGIIPASAAWGIAIVLGIAAAWLGVYKPS